MDEKAVGTRSIIQMVQSLIAETCIVAATEVIRGADFAVWSTTGTLSQQLNYGVERVHDAVLGNASSPPYLYCEPIGAALSCCILPVCVRSTA
jgi:hypothetical protein